MKGRKAAHAAFAVSGPNLPKTLSVSVMVAWVARNRNQQRWSHSAANQNFEFVSSFIKLLHVEGIARFVE
jgi:hypothetical protein